MLDMLSNPLAVSIAGGTLAVISGLLGFTFQSVRTYSRPMARVLGFDDKHKQAPSSIKLNDSTTKLLNSIKSGVFDEVTGISLEDLEATARTLRLYEDSSIGFASDVDQFLLSVQPLRDNPADAAAEKKAMKALRAIIGHQVLDLLLISTIGRGILKFPAISTDSPSRHRVARAHASGGCYLVYLPDPVSIGRGLDKEPANEHYYKDLTSLIERAEFEKLGVVFSELRDVLKGDVPAIKDALKATLDAIHNYTVYSALLYVANLTTAPILINPNASLVVKGIKVGRGATAIPLKLATYKEAKDGNKYPVAVHDAVVLPAGTDIRLIAFTQASSKIANAGVIRAIFETGNTQASVHLSAETIGFPQKRVLRTPWRSFSQEADQE